MTIVPIPGVDAIIGLLCDHAGGLYKGEALTQYEHALQCAALAQAAGAAPALVTAALLHDLGHLAGTDDDECAHGPLAARMLSGLFGPEVTEPIRLHVAAKRYLCAVESGYWAGLSDASRRSLEWQGGVFTRPEAMKFMARPHAPDAVRLRRWDDAAKVPGRRTPPLEFFVAIMQMVALAAEPMAAEMAAETE